MDYNAAEQQISQLQSQSKDVIQHMQQVTKKLSQAIDDPATGREIEMDMREIALGFKQQQQQMMFLLQQMGQHIQELENGMNSHPNPPVQTRGWGMSGGGFLSTLTTGLGLGAGMAVGEDLVDDVFNLF